MAGICGNFAFDVCLLGGRRRVDLVGAVRRTVGPTAPDYPRLGARFCVVRRLLLLAIE